MPPTYSEVVSGLIAPGAPFEIVTEPMHGRAVKTFKNREKNMREKVANAAARGDRDFMVQGERRISYGQFARLCWGTALPLGAAKGCFWELYSPEWAAFLAPGPGKPPTRPSLCHPWSSGVTAWARGRGSRALRRCRT